MHEPLFIAMASVLVVQIIAVIIWGADLNARVKILEQGQQRSDAMLSEFSGVKAELKGLRRDINRVVPGVPFHSTVMSDEG